MTMTTEELGASISASLELGFGHLDKFTRELRRQREIDRVMQPVFRHYALSLVAPANGICVFEFPGPDIGHRWEARSLLVTGVTRASSVQGAVDVFVAGQSLGASLSGSAVTMAAIGTGEQRDFLPGSSLAGVVNFSGTGSAITVTVPAGASWTLQSIAFLYTCSAAVANRNVRVRILDAPAGRTLYTFVDSTALTASQSANVSLAPGNPTQHTLATGTQFIVQGNLPAGLVVPAGGQIIIDAIGIDAADTMTNGTVNFTNTAGSLPVSRQYSRMQLAIYAPENPFIVVSGVASGVEVHAVLDVEDFQLGNIPVIEST